MGIASSVLTAEQKAAWDRDGYVIVPGLFDPAEVAAIRDFFDAIGQKGEPIPPNWTPRLDADPSDVLARWPRVMHPHRFAAEPKAWMLHPGVRDALCELIGGPAVATQSMFYFKPPGAKGQALHQDNFYLRVRPDTCVAAWTAIDPATPANGGMYLVPGTHTMEIVCPEVADANESFTTHLVNAPKGLKAIPAVMAPGDVLFFNGSVVHGSGPNRSRDQWRRAFICHYMPRNSTHIHRGYFPILDFDGHEIPYQPSLEGGPCGEEFANVDYH
jgi:phytanoyl-CoA hydroxylase